MNKQKDEQKEIVYVYIEKYQGFDKIQFNFCEKVQFYIEFRDEKHVVLKKAIHKRILPYDFWGKNISDVSLLIGDNGSGKTTVMRALCQWVCLFSEDHFPSEKGIIVFRCGDDMEYVAFSNRQPMEIDAGIPNLLFTMSKEGRTISDFFKDISLIYYTNTMTELNLPDCDVLLDYSMPQRIKQANSDGKMIWKDVLLNYKKNEFNKQMELMIEKKLRFPVEYVQMEFYNQPFEEMKCVLPENKQIVDDLFGLWNLYFDDCKKNSDFGETAIIIDLLQALFCGIIIKILRWERNFEDYTARFAAVKSLEEIINNEKEHGSSHTIEQACRWMEMFLKDFIVECGELSIDKVFQDEFFEIWGDAVHNVNLFISRLMLCVQQRKSGVFKKWASVFLPQSKRIGIRQIKYDENFEWFWKGFAPVSSYIDNLHFYWNISSGERNKLNLFALLSDMPRGAENVWLLLDEPDNTFHPDWSRKLLEDIIEVCKKYSDLNFQIWISTHSPILLSDIPGIAVTYLSTRKNDNEVVKEKADEQFQDTFGQNIYILFNDAFFLHDGIMGEFASEKITNTVIGLEKIERILLCCLKKKWYLSEKNWNKLRGYIDVFDKIVDLTAEPIFHHQMKGYITNCKKIMKKLESRRNE